RAPGSGSRRQVVQARDHLEVLAPGEQLVERRELAGQPDARPDLRGLVPDVEAGHRRLAGIRVGEGGQDAHRGCLAGAIRTQDGENPPLRDLEVDPAERVRLAEVLLQATRLDHDRVGASHGMRQPTVSRRLPLWAPLAAAQVTVWWPLARADRTPIRWWCPPRRVAGLSLLEPMRRVRQAAARRVAKRRALHPSAMAPMVPSRWGP